MQEEPVLELVVNCLRSKRTWAVVGPEHYWNKYDLPGQYACYKEAETFLTISIHNCPTLIDVTTQADLIAGIEVIDEKRKGLYYNRKRVPGYFASSISTVPLWGSTHHWIMIGIPNQNDDGSSGLQTIHSKEMEPGKHARPL